MQVTFFCACICPYRCALMYLMGNTYGDGYQDAMQEVADKWTTEGAESALAYIKGNLRKGRSRGSCSTVPTRA
jgi:hypothetical protein